MSAVTKTQSWWLEIRITSPKLVSMSGNQNIERTTLPLDALWDNLYLSSSIFWWLMDP
jgi:hypothetical protein